MSENYYQILGVTRDADEREIKRAYYRLARELHPDKADKHENGREIEQKFALVSTAYNLLKDAGQRKDYDRKTFGDQPAPPDPPPQNGAENAAPRATPQPKPPAPVPSSPGVALKDMGAKRVAIAQKAYVKGLQLMKEKDYTKAAEFFEAAIANCETEACFHARLAVALVEAKRSATRAIEAAQKAIELDRYNLDYKFTLAHIYEAIGSKSNATKIYEEILKWDQGNQVAQQMLRELNKKGGLGEKLTGLLGGLRKKAVR